MNEQDLIRRAMEAGDLTVRLGLRGGAEETARAIVEAVVPLIRAQVLEEAASIAGAVQTKLAANAKSCACGNGRVPVTAHRQACEAFATAIRALAPGAGDGE